MPLELSMLAMFCSVFTSFVLAGECSLFLLEASLFCLDLKENKWHQLEVVRVTLIEEEVVLEQGLILHGVGVFLLVGKQEL